MINPGRGPNRRVGEPALIRIHSQTGIVWTSISATNRPQTTPPLSLFFNHLEIIPSFQEHATFIPTMAMLGNRHIRKCVNLAWLILYFSWQRATKEKNKQRKGTLHIIYKKLDKLMVVYVCSWHLIAISDFWIMWPSAHQCPIHWKLVMTRF